MKYYIHFIRSLPVFKLKMAYEKFKNFQIINLNMHESLQMIKFIFFYFKVIQTMTMADTYTVLALPRYG